jgi:hypothetical protein
LDSRWKYGKKKNLLITLLYNIIISKLSHSNFFFFFKKKKKKKKEEENKKKNKNKKRKRKRGKLAMTGSNSVAGHTMQQRERWTSSAVW